MKKETLKTLLSLIESLWRLFSALITILLSLEVVWRYHIYDIDPDNYTFFLLFLLWFYFPFKKAHQ